MGKIQRGSVVVTCEGCGKKFQPRGWSRRCRKGCGRIKWLIDLNCAMCGRAFRAGNSKQTFCSKSCAALNKATFVACAECGVALRRDADGNAWKYCGAKCSDVAKARALAALRLIREAAAKERRMLLERLCAWCGIRFCAARANQKFCRKHCLNIAKKKRRQTLQRSIAGVAAPSLGEIYTRDKGVCQLCGTRVGRRRYRWPHPRSASLDHITPVSYGGSDAEWNIQLAHLGCNHSKGAGRCGSQMRIPL